MSLSHTELLRLLHYSHETGEFTRKIKTSNSVKVGDVAGGISEGRYIKINVGGGVHYAHRLAWFYVTGAWPTLHIDHKNGNGLDNRFSNLRDVDVTTNGENKRYPTRRNLSGLLGVHVNHKGFQARITVHGKRISLGTFQTPELAHSAYVDAKRSLHSGCTI